MKSDISRAKRREALGDWELHCRALSVAVTHVTNRARDEDDEDLAAALLPFEDLPLAQFKACAGRPAQLVAHLAAAAWLYLEMAARGHGGDGREILAHVKQDYHNLDLRARRDPVREAME